MERALLEGIEERSGAGRVGGRRAFGVVDTAPREACRGESDGELCATRHVVEISRQTRRAGHRYAAPVVRHASRFALKGEAQREGHEPRGVARNAEEVVIPRFHEHRRSAAYPRRKSSAG